KLLEDVAQVLFVGEPDAVRHEFVEAKAEFGGAAGDRNEEFGVKERFAAGEAENCNSGGAGLFQEAQGDADVEAIGPFDGNAAVRATEVALIGAGEREVIGAEGAGTAAYRPSLAPRQRRQFHLDNVR